MKFLITDDEPLALRKLEKILLKLYPDAEIVKAENPSEALEHKDEKFSVAFLDIEMPEMSGVELAEKLQAVNPRLNVIFQTAYNQYALHAYQLHASGYLTKPYGVSEVQAEMEHLRYPVAETELIPKETDQSDGSNIRIQCFGYFEVFDGDEPIRFERKTSKEILAYLVHLRGASASRMDISSILWEDSVEIDRKKGYFRSLITSLRNTLREHHAENLLNCRRDSFSFVVQGADVDLYRYLDGDQDLKSQFHGEYMSQYSWAEYAIGALEEQGWTI